MKHFIALIIFLLSTQLASSQTELIACKSHSGNMASFYVDSDDNLGIPPMRIDTIIILNDSTIIEISSRNWSGWPGFCLKDTVTNHPMYQSKSDYEKLRGNYYDKSIVFINYDTLTVKQKKKLAKKNKKNKKSTATLINYRPPNSGNKLMLLISLITIVSFTLIWFHNKRKLSF